jgi:hypothetical protein
VRAYLRSLRRIHVCPDQRRQLRRPAFAKDFGWGAELKLEMIFQQLFGFGHGNGTPRAGGARAAQQEILDQVKEITTRTC